jgi:hypothetical protein
MPSWPPHASRRSRASACDLRDARRRALPDRRGIHLEDATGNEAIGEHVVIAPLAGWAGSRGAFDFNRIRYRRHDGDVFLYAFDLIELNGDDLRTEPLERRKVLLMRLLAKASVDLF